jgi:delta(3,5)-delta(2,4)-dienoyl-CoA isomerase
MEWNKIEDFDVSFVDNNTVAIVQIDRQKKYNAMAFNHF